MSKRKDNQYNNNVIINNKVVSVNDLQTDAKSASMRFFVLLLGIALLASMVVPYLSMAAAATSGSNAFNGTVIPGYSMGGLELTAYGIDLNSWGQTYSPKFVQSNYGIWSTGNLPKNREKVEQQFVEENNNNANVSQITADNLTNTSDKSAGWEQLTGHTNYTNNNPNGSTSVSQNEKVDNVSPVRTQADYNYWDSKVPTSNSSNDANITVSLMPDFVIISQKQIDDNTKVASIVQSPDDTSTKSIMALDSDKYTYNDSKPMYIPISALMSAYRNEMGDGVHTFDDLFNAVAKDSKPLNDVVANKGNDLLESTSYLKLNGAESAKDSTGDVQAFNPYPYTMVFSTQDSVTNQTVVSSIYENCEAYVYFSPSVVYQKYLQVKNEYNSIVNSASDDLNSDSPDAVTVLQVGYYAAALSILEAYLEEALPQDATRGYVGMSETNALRGDNGSDVGQAIGISNADLSDPTSFQNVTYATLMYDVAAKFKASEAGSSECALDETNAIMDSLSVFGYTKNETTKYNAGVMAGMNRDENLERRTNLTPRLKEDSSSDEFSERIKAAQDKYDQKVKEYNAKMADSHSAQIEQNMMREVTEAQKELDDAKNAKAVAATDSKYTGIYTPVYYPIQQHKMPDNEKTYRFSILANIPYNTVIEYMNQAKLGSVTLSYSSNFTSSFKNVTDLFEKNGKKKTALEQLIQQYNSGDEDTGLDLASFDASASIVCSPQNNTNKTDTGTDQDKATEDTVQDRVDSALLGFSSGNMTSDNVHDLVDVMRALPAGKIETFYRFFNPIKSDGDDQDFFVTRVTPAVTTYFPSLLVNGYENAGGAEVDIACATSNVSFDYFSIPSFAPCFASHTASDTYYGALNYELRAFYKKSFIKTLSTKTNIPQIEEAQDAMNDADESASKLQDSDEIDADTMAKNIKTIFVEAKRLAAIKTIQNAKKSYKKGQHGTLNMNTIKTFYDEIFETAFNNSFNISTKIDKITGDIEGNDDDEDSYAPNTTNYNKWTWKEGVHSFDDIASSTARTKDGTHTNNPADISEQRNWAINNMVNDNADTLLNANDVKKAIKKAKNTKGIITALLKLKSKGSESSTSKKGIDSKFTESATSPDGTPNLDTDVSKSTKIYNDEKDVINIWNTINKKTGGKMELDNKGNIKAKTTKLKNLEDTSIKGFYWQLSNDFKEAHSLASFSTTIAMIEQADDKTGLKFGHEYLAQDPKMDLYVVPFRNTKSSNKKKAYGPVAHNQDANLLVTNDYLTNANKMIVDKDGKYYWGDYHEIEKSTAVPAVEGDLRDGEANSLFIVGFTTKWGIWQTATDQSTEEDYANKVEKALKDSCKEMFKDLTNVAKDMQLIQQSMPSQMQNCLAWADYQNASDSEAQYQTDPATDKVEVNLSQKDTNAKDDYDKADAITGLNSLQEAGYDIDSDGSVKINKSVTGATNSAIQARMERGVEGSTWTSSVQPACYTITAIIARIDIMQNSGTSYPYNNICSGRLRSGADQYSMLQAHVIDYSSIASGISGDLATRVYGKVVSIVNPNYSALPDFLNILGTIGGIIAEAASGFANLTGSMFEDAMWGGNEQTTRVETSDNQNDDGTIHTSQYDGTGNIERKGSMWVLDSNGGESFYTLVQSLALVLVLVSLLYIAFKNFYEYTRPASAATAIDDKDDAGNKSAAAEKKILAATQLKVVLPRAIIAVFMIGLPPMSNGTGFQGGNFLLLQMLSSVFNQISNIFINLNGQSVMNLWLKTGDDLLSNNPNIGEYIAYGVAMLVIGVMFVIGTISVYIMDAVLILFYIIGPLMWALYVWPYNDTTSKVEKKDGIISKLTSKMKFAWTGGRVGNKAPEGMIECYCQTAMLNVVWAIMFWAVTIIFTGVTGTITTPDDSASAGNSATLASAASYTKSALMATGNYSASASVAHADGLLNAGILPLPAWGRMLIAALLAFIVFMLMIRMASGMFKKSLFNTFGAVSAIGGAIRGGAIGGMLGSAAKLAKAGTNVAEGIGHAKNIADKAKDAAHKFGQASARGKLHQIGQGARALGNHGSNALRKAGNAANNAGKYLSGDKNLTDGFTKTVNGINRRLNDRAAANQKDTLKRLTGTNDAVSELRKALGANDTDKAQSILDGMTPEQKRLLSHYAPDLFKENRNGHDLQLRDEVTDRDFDRVQRSLGDRIDATQERIARRTEHSDDAVSQGELRAHALEASGIDDVDSLRKTLLSPDTDNRTKRAARNKLNDFSRRMYGTDIDWNTTSDAKALGLLSQHIPTSDERSDRLVNAASNAASTGREAMTSFAHRHGLNTDGDAAQITARELERVSDSMNTVVPNIVATSANVDDIRQTINQHTDTLSKAFENRGYTSDEARMRALDEISAQYGGNLSISEAQKLQQDITHGGAIDTNNAIRLELFRQKNNIGNDGYGDRILNSAKGMNDLSYARGLANVDDTLLSNNAYSAKITLQDAHDYKQYVDNYSIPSAAYNSELQQMLNNMTNRHDRKELQHAIETSPFNALLNSGKPISRNNFNNIINAAESSGTPISHNVISAMETLYSNVSSQAFENDTNFKNNLLSNLSSNRYSSADEAMSELDEQNLDYENLEGTIRASVQNNLSAAHRDVSLINSDLSLLSSQITQARNNMSEAVKNADAEKQKEAAEQISILTEKRKKRHKDLTSAQTRVKRIQVQLDGISGTSAPSTSSNPLGSR